MRDPARIKQVCDRLKAIWSIVPDLRLGQIIIIAATYGNIEDLFNVEDDKLIEAIEDGIHMGV